MKLSEKSLTLYKDIEGFSSIEEQGALFKKILSDIDGNDRLKIAEVGVYKGRMTAMICEMLSLSGVQAQYFCVDNFKGSQEHERKDYFPDFWNNTKDIDIPGVEIVIIQRESIVASELVENHSFDIVYLDASHDYESVKADISAWLPKIKEGGILCGDDYIHGWDGVIQAVNEAFGEKVERVGNQQWMIRL